MGLFAHVALALALGCGFFGCGSSCAKDTERPAALDPPPHTVPTSVSLFSDQFQFACSPDRQAGCEGVFAVRRASSDLPPQVAVLRGGEDSFRARMQLLENAKRSIRIQALIFRGDDAGLRVAEVLKKKAAEGLTVRVIVDALSNLESKTQWMYFDLKQHGVEVEGYETLYLNWLSADLKASDLMRPNKRFHDKMWIVDAEDLTQAKAVVGGLNIANEYFRVDPEPMQRWRDQDVLLRGVIVKDVGRAFDRNYDYFKGLKERLPRLFNPDNSWKLTRAVLEKVSRIRTPRWKRPEIGAAIEAVLGKEAKVNWRPAKLRFLQSRPRFSETYILQAYHHLIDRAQHRIDIANAYFVPSRRMIEALKAAARRGVTVRIITNSPITNDIGPIAVISRHLYSDLLAVNEEGPVKAWLQQGRGMQIREWVGPEMGEGTLHAKFALFDDDIALVGSYNLDPRSAHLNSETAIAIEDKEAVAELRDLFEKQDFALSRDVPYAKAITYRAPEKLRDQFELLFALPLKGWL